MKLSRIRLVAVAIVLLFHPASIMAFDGHTVEKNGNKKSSFLLSYSRKSLSLQNDTILNSNFASSERKNAIQPWIAPALLITGGTAMHFMPGVKEKTRNFMQENLSYRGSLDDYGQFAPLAAVYLLNLTGIRGENNFGNRTALAVKSILLNSFLTSRLKYWVNAPRPNLGIHSFPSGHTSTAFTFAHFMHREYGSRSFWYSIGAYTGASAVGIMRMARNAHWLPDVLMGAGTGILSTELVYLTHQYKWDNQHLKRLDILPFSNKKSKGLTLVYTF